jgi:hypothetical protein
MSKYLFPAIYCVYEKRASLAARSRELGIAAACARAARCSLSVRSMAWREA